MMNISDILVISWDLYVVVEIYLAELEPTPEDAQWARDYVFRKYFKVDHLKYKPSDIVSASVLTWLGSGGGSERGISEPETDNETECPVPTHEISRSWVQSEYKLLGQVNNGKCDPQDTTSPQTTC